MTSLRFYLFCDAGSAFVIIHVTDENDNPPIFEKDRYNATLLESKATQTSVLLVKATDADEGKSLDHGRVSADQYWRDPPYWSRLQHKHMVI